MCGPRLGGWVKRDVQKFETKIPLALTQICTFIFQGPAQPPPSSAITSCLYLLLSPFLWGPLSAEEFPVAACCPLCPISHSCFPSCHSFSCCPVLCPVLCSVSSPCAAALPFTSPQTLCIPHFPSGSSPGLSPDLPLVLLLWIPTGEGNDSTSRATYQGDKGGSGQVPSPWRPRSFKQWLPLSCWRAEQLCRAGHCDHAACRDQTARSGPATFSSPSQRGKLLFFPLFSCSESLVLTSVNNKPFSLQPSFPAPSSVTPTCPCPLPGLTGAPTAPGQHPQGLLCLQPTLHPPGLSRDLLSQMSVWGRVAVLLQSCSSAELFRDSCPTQKCSLCNLCVSLVLKNLWKITAQCHWSCC